jgi:hypothetical protein
MPTSLIDADSLLAIDIGSVTTRAVLFDVVDGRYRFLASGSAASTANAPFNDIGEGIRNALDRLHAVTGRKFVGGDERLIIPSRSDGAGVDTVAATMSAGPSIKVVLVGLLDDVSLDSVKHLASTTYSQVVETFSLNDHRSLEARIDTFLCIQPDLILVAGGTNGGASQSVLKLIDVIGLASYLSPQEKRPEVLYVGNQALVKEVKGSLGKIAPLHIASNVRPTLDVEQLDAAQVKLANITRSIRSRQITGIKELNSWAKGGLLPTATAFGRVIRFLSKVYDSDKGVLGIDLGASAVTVAAAYSGELVQSVSPQLGLGKGLATLLDHCSLGDILRWLHLEIPKDYVRQYLYNKSLYPGSLPATPEDLAIEQALARQVMQLSLKQIMDRLPENEKRYRKGLLPWFEPIVASGSVFTRAPNLAQSLLTLLDGLQPTGVTTVVLDQHHLSPPLGVAAAVNPILAVQVLESSTFLNMATVISPIGDARPGTPVLRVRMVHENGSETSVEIKQGSLDVLQLPVGQSAQVHLQPLHRYDVGMGGPGRGGRLQVVGGALGVVIDARGRPLRLDSNPARRRELMNKWRTVLGC